jgi:hypothetical protein
MLAQNKRRPSLLSQLINNAALKLLDLQEVNQPQHIDFQRRLLVGWPHRRSMQCEIKKLVPMTLVSKTISL